MMSTEQNKALVRHAYDLCNRRELDAYFDLFSSGYVFHSVDGDLSGEQARIHELEWFAAFPDIRVTIVDMVAEGDKVAVRVNWKGTHTGKGYGWTPTGKKIDITNANTFKIVNGKLVELWNVCDMRLLQQLSFTKG